MIKRKFKKVIIAVAFLIASTALYMQVAPTVSAEACHATNIYYEARGESKEGMKAIASVVINRKNNTGKTDCEIIFQKNQFSWTNQQNFEDIQKLLNGDLSDLSDKDRQAYQQARLIAHTVLTERLKVLPDTAMWYHAEYVKPRWSTKLKKVKRIGKHIFYAKLNDSGYKAKG